MATIGLTLTGSACTGVLLFALQDFFFFNFGVLKTLGKYIYSLYVFHEPVLFFTYRLLIRLKVSDVMFVPLFLALSTGIVFLLVYLSWQVVEKRFLSVKKRFVVQDPSLVPASSLNAAA